MNNKEMSRFWEFVKGYRKIHLTLWIISGTASLFLLSFIIPNVIILLLGGGMILWVYKQVQIGWTDQKIHNLLLYKQITQEKFSLLEQEVIDRYLGRFQRREQVLDLDMKKKWIGWVSKIDLGVIALVALTSCVVIFRFL